jgi:integrase
MGKLIDKVLDHVRPGLAKTSARQYTEVGERLKKILVEFEPGQVLPRHVAAIKLSMAKTPNMANRVLSVMRLIFGQLVEWQLIDTNPCIGVKPYKEHGRDRYITPDEFRRIRDQAGPRLAVIMDLQYLTGQRISDVLAIRTEDLTDAGIAFRQQKTGAKIIVQWSPELRAAVDRARGLNGNVRPLKTLLCNRRGKPPDYRTVYLQWTKACAAAGVADARINDLRAAAITDVDDLGGDATALAGHTTRAMTRRYIRHRKPKPVTGPSNRTINATTTKA